MTSTLRRFTVALTAAALLLVSTPASAQLTQQRHLFELGLYVGPQLLSGKHDLMGSSAPEHQAFANVAAEIGLRVGYLPLAYLGIELEASIVPSKADGRSAIAYGVRGHLLAQYPIWRDLTPFLLLGGGLLGVASPANLLGKDADGTFHWGAGLKVYFLKWVSVRLEFRHALGDGLYKKVAHHFSVLAGASVVLNWESDTDGDGIPDQTDHCPGRPGKAPSGCPDTDGDGLTDDRDKCPKEPANTRDGCAGDTDKDKDTIPDSKDRCRHKAGPAPHGCPDTDGDTLPDHMDRCPGVAARTPSGCPSDRDGDGVVDKQDRCPNQPGLKPTGCLDSDGDGVVDPEDKCPKLRARTPNGCPLDKDGDGVPDMRDKCPNLRENLNGWQDEDGCPDKIPSAVRRFTGTIRGIKFAKNKVRFRSRSYKYLRRVARTLKKYPALRIRIRAHTDNRGDVSKNVKLSLRRAQAVKDWLVKQGIPAQRLAVEGVGPREPIAGNKRGRGRAKNNRIELKLIYKGAPGAAR